MTVVTGVSCKSIPSQNQYVTEGPAIREGLQAGIQGTDFSTGLTPEQNVDLFQAKVQKTHVKKKQACRGDSSSKFD